MHLITIFRIQINKYVIKYCQFDIKFIKKHIILNRYSLLTAISEAARPHLLGYHLPPVCSRLALLPCYSFGSGWSLVEQRISSSLPIIKEGHWTQLLLEKTIVKMAE